MTHQPLTPQKDKWECCSLKSPTANYSGDRERNVNRSRQASGCRGAPQVGEWGRVGKDILGSFNHTFLKQFMIFTESSFSILIKDRKLVHDSLGTLRSHREDGIWNRAHLVIWDASICFQPSLWNLIRCYLGSNFSISSMIPMAIVSIAAKT